jgi:hypothetical protein
MQQPTFFIVYSVQSCDTQEPTIGRPQHVLNLRQVAGHGEQRVFLVAFPRRCGSVRGIPISDQSSPPTV